MSGFDLEERLLNKTAKFYILIGAGVSIGTANTPGWRDLLVAGQRHAEQTPDVNPHLISALADFVHDDDLVLASRTLRLALGDGEFGNFLNLQFGKYRQNPSLVSDPSVYDLLRKLRLEGARLMTTNYDTIPDDVLSLTTVDWKDNNVIRFFSSDSTPRDRLLMHIHGVWTNPRDCIFEPHDYDRLKKATRSLDHVDETSMLGVGLREALLDGHVLFLGCGGTVNDDHFKSLFRFLQGIDPPYDIRHVLLCPPNEVVALRRIVPSCIRVSSIPGHDIAGALRTLFPRTLSGDRSSEQSVQLWGHARARSKLLEEFRPALERRAAAGTTETTGVDGWMVHEEYVSSAIMKCLTHFHPSGYELWVHTLYFYPILQPV